jgi:hypothetical protein
VPSEGVSNMNGPEQLAPIIHELEHLQKEWLRSGIREQGKEIWINQKLKIKNQNCGN